VKLNCRKLLEIVLLISGIIGCHSTDQMEIANVINKVYENADPYVNLNLNTNVYTEHLNEQLEQSKKIGELDRQRILESEYPTDKPKIIEGNIFTSLYEGFTSYEIKEVKIDQEKATVLVEFKNLHFDVIWEDEIVLIHEDGWKIDNINYQKELSGITNLKEFLLNFIEEE
jgi:hypothetical protein